MAYYHYHYKPKNILEAVTVNDLKEVRNMMNPPHQYNLRKRKGHWEEMEKKRLNFMEPTWNGRNIFHLAAGFNNIPMIDYLAEVYPGDLCQALNPPNIISPLVCTDERDTILKLINLGAGSCQTFSSYAYHTLIHAIQDYNYDKVQLFLENGITPFMPDKSFTLPLAVAQEILPHMSTISIYRDRDTKINNMKKIIETLIVYMNKWIGQQMLAAMMDNDRPFGYFAVIPRDIFGYITQFNVDWPAINHT